MPCVVCPAELCQEGPLASPTDAGAEGRGILSSAGCGLLRPPSVLPAVAKLRTEAVSSTLLSGREAPGCALPGSGGKPGGKSTSGAGGRRTGCAASPPSGHLLASARSRAMTSSGPSADNASPSDHASRFASSLSVHMSPSVPSMAFITSRSSPRTSAAVGGLGALPTGVLGLEIVGRTGVLALEVDGRGGVGAGDGANGLPAAAGAGGPAAGSPGPRWPPAALPPPGACCGTPNILENSRTAKTFFLAPCYRSEALRARRAAGPTLRPAAPPQWRGTSAERLVEVATEAQRHRWPGAAPLAP